MKRLVCWLRSSLDYVLGPKARSRPGLKASRAKRRSRRLMLEPLEERTLMSGTPTISWDGGGGDDRRWLNELNWTEDRLPGPFDHVGISVPGEQVTVELSASPGTGTSIRSLYSEENLEISGDFSLAAASEIVGTLTFRDGSINLQSGADLVLRGSETRIMGFLNVPSGVTAHFGSGSYFLMGGLIAGTLDLAPGATLNLGEGGYIFQEGARIGGNGLVRVSQATVTIEGSVTAQNLLMNNGGEVRGPGTLTVTQSFSWQMGTLSGSGSLVVAPTATFHLPFGSGRTLAGRQLIVEGTRTWDRHTWNDGLDPIVFATYFEANSGAPLFLDDGRFDNARVSTNPVGSVAPGPLTLEQADALAGQIYDAMYGGLVGAGVDTEAIYRALANRSRTDVNVIASAYFVRYSPRVLREDLESQWAISFSTIESARLNELLRGNQPGADAAQIRGIVSSSTHLVTSIRDILYRGNISAIAAEYARLYPTARVQYPSGERPAEALLPSQPLQYDVQYVFNHVEAQRRARSVGTPRQLFDIGNRSGGLKGRSWRAAFFLC